MSIILSNLKYSFIYPVPLPDSGFRIRIFWFSIRHDMASVSRRPRAGNFTVAEALEMVFNQDDVSWRYTQ